MRFIGVRNPFLTPKELRDNRVFWKKLNIVLHSKFIEEETAQKKNKKKPFSGSRKV
jgi:hypothetical protein